jgi:hypothetical protein
LLLDVGQCIVRRRNGVSEKKTRKKVFKWKILRSTQI